MTSPNKQALSGIAGIPSAGPWEVRVNGVFLRVVHGEHKTTVADGIVSEANARLIAAAPEMFAALTDLVNSFEKHRPKQYWDAARAAIAKARGQ